jgi:hypothetical protein
MKILSCRSRSVNFVIRLPNSQWPAFSAGGNDKVACAAMEIHDAA